MVLLISTSCNLNPANKDQFDLRDTVTVSVGEKLYENENLWVRLDKITEDSRCPEDLQCYMPGRVAGQFTVGGWGSLEILKFATDTLNSLMFTVPGESDFPDGSTYILTIIDVSPERPDLENSIPRGDYRVHFVLEEGIVVYKPNIYLYPKMISKMDVSFTFPQGGNVTVSNPSYPEEWQNIKVNSSGKIDGQHDFLFYEAALPDKWQYEEGWAVKQAGLKTFFEDNLKAYGFNNREIIDFTDYWIPRLKNSPYYAIYPQHTVKIDEVVELNISKNPKSILRLFYVIKDIPEFEDMPIPMIPEFERKGFTVTEWGVILK